MVAIPNSGLPLTWTHTSPSGLWYSIGFKRLRLLSEKNGRSITSRWSFSGKLFIRGTNRSNSGSRTARLVIAARQPARAGEGRARPGTRNLPMGKSPRTGRPARKLAHGQVPAFGPRSDIFGGQ